MPEIKPCPKGHTPEPFVSEVMGVEYGYACICDSGVGLFKTPEAALAAWNARVDDRQPTTNPVDDRDLVERVARAITAHYMLTSDVTGSYLPDDMWQQSVPIALAAIAAMPDVAAIDIGAIEEAAARRALESAARIGPDAFPGYANAKPIIAAAIRAIDPAIFRSDHFAGA